MADEENIMLADLGTIRHENLPMQGNSSSDDSFDIDRSSPRRATISHPSEAMSLQRDVVHEWKKYLSFQPEEHRDHQAEHLREFSSMGSGQSHRHRMQASLLSDFRDNVSNYYSARGRYRGGRGGGQAGRGSDRGGRGSRGSRGGHGNREDRGESSISRDIPGHTGYQAVQRGIIGIRSHVPLPRGLSSSNRGAWEMISGNVGREVAPDTTLVAPTVARGATRGPLVTRGRGSSSGSKTSAPSNSAVAGGFLANKNRPPGRPTYRPARPVTAPKVTVTRAPTPIQSSRNRFDPARLDEAGFVAAYGLAQQGVARTESVAPKSSRSPSTHSHTGSFLELTQMPGFGNAVPIDKGKQVDRSSFSQPETFMHVADSDSKGSGSGFPKVNSLVTPDRPLPIFEPLVDFERTKATSPEDKRTVGHPFNFEVGKAHDKGKGKQVERLASPFEYDTGDRSDVEGKQFVKHPVASDDNRVRDPMSQKEFDSVLEKSRSLAEGIKSAKREAGHLHPAILPHTVESEALIKSNSDVNGKTANLTPGDDYASAELRGAAVSVSELGTKNEDPDKPQGEYKDFLNIFDSDANKKSEPTASKRSGSTDYGFNSTINGDLKGLLFQQTTVPGNGRLQYHGSSGYLAPTEPWSSTSNLGRENAVNVIASSNGGNGETMGVLSNAIGTTSSRSLGPAPAPVGAVLTKRDEEKESHADGVDENFPGNIERQASVSTIRSRSDIYRGTIIGNMERRLQGMADDLAELSAIDAIDSKEAYISDTAAEGSHKDTNHHAHGVHSQQSTLPAETVPSHAFNRASTFSQETSRVDSTQGSNVVEPSIYLQMVDNASQSFTETVSAVEGRPASTSLHPANQSVDLELNTGFDGRGPSEIALAASDARQKQQTAHQRPQKRPDAYAENGIYSSRYADPPPRRGLGVYNTHTNNTGIAETQNRETGATQESWFETEMRRNLGCYYPSVEDAFERPLHPQ